MEWPVVVDGYGWKLSLLSMSMVEVGTSVSGRVRSLDMRMESDRNKCARASRRADYARRCARRARWCRMRVAGTAAGQLPANTAGAGWLVGRWWIQLVDRASRTSDGWMDGWNVQRRMTAIIQISASKSPLPAAPKLRNTRNKLIQ